VLDLLKIEDERAAQIEGVSLAPYVLRPGASVDISFSYSQRRPSEGRKGWVPGLVIAAQTPDWKYIYNETREDEIYDLRSDPQEKTNLAGQELREAEQLRRRLLTHYRDMHENRPADAGEIEPEFLEELKALGYVD
jgi:arylsulfatase A-like enzyme